MTYTIVTHRVIILAFVVAGAYCQESYGQTSSLGAKKRKAQELDPPKKSPREASKRRRNPIYERHSWISVTPKPLPSFKVNDLITIIVRQRTKFEADSELKTKKTWDIKSELEAFVKGTAGGLGAAAFRRGKPTIDYGFENKLKGKGELDREDRFTTRITVKIIDVKPNGNLVLEGRARVTFDDESSMITLTGTCRKKDVTPDNTILSTQLADLDTQVDNNGALRAASTRGWLTRLVDWFKPI